MGAARSLTRALNTTTPRVRDYIAALEAENRKLQKRLAKLEVAVKSQEHRYKALAAEFDAYRKSGTVKELMDEVARRGRSLKPKPR